MAHTLPIKAMKRSNDPQNEGDLNMTLNCIWCLGSRYADLQSVEYSSIAITLRFNLILLGFPLHVKSSSSSSSLSLPTRISLTLSRHTSLWSIAPERSSRVNPVSTQSYGVQVLASHPAFVRLCGRVHRSMSLTFPAVSSMPGSSILDSFGYGWQLAAQLLVQYGFAAFLCNCRQAFSPYI